MEKRKEIYLAIKKRSDQLGTLLASELRELVSEQDFVNLSTKQLMLLDLLNSTPLTMNEIANSFQMTASAASQLVKKLEANNYVKREINLDNRREIYVKLDSKGIDYSKKMEEFEYYLLERYYGQLEEKDLNQLKSIFDKLYVIMLSSQNKE